MNKYITFFFLLLLSVACSEQPEPQKANLPADGPIQLHPENGHYFLYRGKTTALITSGEHYGAVLNLAFDYKTYLKTLAEDGMNYTRIFTGTYFENPGDFGISRNTLAPEPANVCTPWSVVISDMSGKVQYDLNAWNPTYFERLKDFLKTATDYNIIVEVTLFSSVYQDKTWEIIPQNPVNNINIAQELDRRKVHTLDNGELWNYQEKFIRKMVNELNGFDNFFFEIQNEPWSDRTNSVYNIVNKEELKKNDWSFKADFADEASLAWQKKVAEVIANEEGKLKQKHLIAQNYTNFRAPIPNVDSNISIINFHYAWPETAIWNYHYNKVLGFDESGFAGSDDQVYRRQAWQFMLSGGGLFNNLDYSFYAGSEDGLGENNAPGGGSKILRNQLKILRDFLQEFELARLYPNTGVIESSPGLIPYILSDGSEAFAVFVRAIAVEQTRLWIRAESGTYKIQYLNTITGEYSGPVIEEVVDGILKINIAAPDGELAVKINREG